MAHPVRGLSVLFLLAAFTRAADAPEDRLAAAVRALATRDHAAASPTFRGLLTSPSVATAAHNGLAVCLLVGPDKDAARARELLRPPPADGAQRRTALYLHGWAQVLLGNDKVAGRVLSHLTTARDFEHGGHVHYLLGRVLQRSREVPEAASHYEAALRQPAPAWADRAAFWLAVARVEQGRFEDAHAAFAEFTTQHPRSPLLPRARLGHAATAVVLNRPADAVPLLEDLTESGEPASAARHWLGKARLLRWAEEGEEEREATGRAALDDLARAAEYYRARPADGAARSRLAAVLLDAAEARGLVGDHAGAARLYGELLAERHLPSRGEELRQRRVTALALAGQHTDVLREALAFLADQARGPFAAEVHFRRAESAAFLAQAAQGPATVKHAAEAESGFRLLLERFPEHPALSSARHGLALLHFRRGELDAARTLWEAVPTTDCTGELAAVPYLLAECLIRQLPADADDALAAGRLEADLRTAIGLLEGYAQDLPEPSHVPDALLRLAHVRRRLAALLAQPEEADRQREEARAALQRLQLDFPWHPLQPHSALERARDRLRADDGKAAERLLTRFRQEPLRPSPLAALALLEYAGHLRASDRAAEAARVLAEVRRHHESGLAADEARASWVAVLHYHHGAALLAAGRPAEARARFETARTRFAGRPEAAEALRCRAECLVEEARRETEQADAVLQRQRPDREMVAEQLRASARKKEREAIASIEEEAERWKGKTGPARPRLLYTAAWFRRLRMVTEIQEARERLPEGKRTGPVELQPSERRAREYYRTLIADYPDLRLAHAARLELGELLAERGETATALRHFREALDREPPAWLAERMRLRLAVGCEAIGDAAGARRQLSVLAAKPDGEFTAQAQYRLAESHLKQGDLAAAEKAFLPLRDVEALQNVGGISDRALVRLGQVLLRRGRLAEARQAFALVPERHRDGPWTAESHYGIAWAWFREGKHTEAMAALAGTVADPESVVAARGRILRGVCLARQGRTEETLATLREVGTDGRHRELAALALAEARHIARTAGRTTDADALGKQLARDHPGSVWEKPAPQGEVDQAPHARPVGQRLLTPDLAEPLPLDLLGQPSEVDPVLEEAVGTLLDAEMLRRPPPQQRAPTPLAPTGPRDPDELRELARSLTPAELD